MYSEIELAIKQRNLSAIMKLMFETDAPVLRSGFKTETELWDFKADCPKAGKAQLNAWADLAKANIVFL